METKDESPVRNLKNILSKKKKPARKDTASTLGSNSPARESTDSVTDKLLPVLSKRKEKKRRKSQSKQDDSTDNLPANGAQTSKSTESLGVSPSASTLNDERSSLLTSDSDPEMQAPRSAAPPLISHESHAGYLTSTSPDIQTTAVPAQPTAANAPNLRTLHPLSKAATLPVKSEPFQDNAVGGSSAPSSNSFSLATESTSRSRSISPSSRPKEPAPMISGKLANRRLSKGSESGVIPSIRVSDDVMSQDTQSTPSMHTVPESPPKEPPKTTITPPTPVDGEDPATEATSRSAAAKPLTLHASPSRKPNASSIPRGNMVTHRRIRSDSNTPSKLSHTMSAPLTPTLEEARGSRNASGASTTSNGGFFSSVFSVAQNAASTISSTLGTTTARPRSSASQKLSPDDQDTKGAHSSNEAAEDEEHQGSETSKTLAIDTIGSGDLNFSDLGISTDTQMTNGSVAPSDTVNELGAGRGRSDTVIHNEEAAVRNEGISAARAVSAAYDVGQDLPASTPVAEDVVGASQPPLTNEMNFNHEKTIFNGNAAEGENSGLFRSGSLRSSVRKRTRRHRNSSGTATSAIGAAIAASHTALGTPGNASAPKITGFAVANKKRNRDFHQLFRSVPEDDYLIEDYSCALQRDIILAGRIYISEGHICFSSNILGWVTTLVISFDEVVSVEKENTAMLFANAIAIQTLHARHTFRSLLSRDATYDLIIGIWKINHPGIQSSENGVRLATGTGSKTEKIDHGDALDESEGSIISGEIYDEDDDDSGIDETLSAPGTREASVNGSDLGDVAPKITSARKPSAMVGIAAGQAAGAGPVLGDTRAAEKAAGAAVMSVDFPGPVAHAPTECTDTSSHYDKLLKDEVVPAPLGKVYSMVFGAASGGFMSRWLIDDVKVTDLQMEDDKKGLTEDRKTRSFTYIKPLNSSLGPKTTKCIITEQLDSFDLEKAISVTVTTQTPDVPSGNLFSTKTRYCFMWGPNNGTRIIMCFALEWSGKSWIKGAIEKGANDGQITYANDLIKALRTGLSARSRTVTSVSKKKLRKRKSEGDALKPAVHDSSSRTVMSSWGPLEPLRKLVNPMLETCKPLFTLQSLVGLLVFLLIISWFGNSRHRNISPTHGFAISKSDSAQRIAAYEEIWRSEEAALWEWLEERVGLGDGWAFPTEVNHRNADRSRHGEAGRQKVLDGEAQESGSMSEREVEWAIKLTEEKLKLLKQKVRKGRVMGESSEGNEGRDR